MNFVARAGQEALYLQAYKEAKEEAKRVRRVEGAKQNAAFKDERERIRLTFRKVHMMDMAMMEIGLRRCFSASVLVVRNVPRSLLVLGVVPHSLA
mgnify:CR=1 FL=1